MAGVVIDSSVWIAFLGGSDTPLVEEALVDGVAILSPLVVSELVSGATTPAQRHAIGELLQDAPIHHTPLEHWIRVGDLRRSLSRKGLLLTVPDAHIAQCALSLDAVLLTRDGVFALAARHVPLRLG